GRACGETFVLTWLLGVSRGDTWLFLLDLVEVRDVGSCVVRLWSHVVAPVFRELLCLGGCVLRVVLLPLLLEFLLLWLIRRWRRDLRASLAGVWEVVSFPIGSECELQESVAAVAGCACCERGCWFTRAAFGFVLGLRVHVGVSQRLREPACGVAFTGAGLWSAELVEVGILARGKQMLVCRVASLVERCDTWLWLLSACVVLWVEVHRLDAVFWWCFPELFVVVLVSVVWLVAVALPSRLRCIAWLLCVLVRFPRIVGCGPGEGCSQDYSGLFLPVVVLP
ncbi:hypothetical protein Taro_013938, partial [Colocasia esculenta]|nr:hypothetical protein [Colocasia esculenta]